MSQASTSPTDADTTPSDLVEAARATPFEPESLQQFVVLPMEVIGLIANHLSTVDLARCVRVSLGFREIWADHVFREIELATEVEFASFELPSLRRFFRSHCRLTRSFMTNRGYQYGQLLQSSRCSGVRRLVLLFENSSIQSQETVFELIKSVALANSRLDHVVLHGRYNWITAPALFANCCFLSCLDLDFEGEVLSDSVSSQSEDGPSPPKAKCLQALKQLHLAGFRGSYGGLLVLLRECGNLESIRFKLEGAWMPSKETKGEQKELLGNVESMAWEASEMDEEELKDMLALGAEPKQVSLSAPFVRSLAPLVERAATLKSLTLDGVLGPFASELQELLEKATALEKLHALPTDRFENHHVRLLARNFHDRSGEMQLFDDLAGATGVWGCASTLTRLEIVIERLYPTYVNGTTVTSDGNTLPLSIECISEHSISYRQLGELNNLQHLRLGQEMAPRRVGGRDEVGGYQTNCLLFSNDSNIGLLSGMMSIKTLDVRWTAHEIGCQELQWMRSNWPQLRTILGLTDLPAHAGKDWKRRSQGAAAWVKAHPRGIGSDL